jgi:hypothetical protein
VLTVERKWSSVSFVVNITVPIVVASMNVQRSFDMKTTMHVLVDCAECRMKFNRNSAFATLDRYGQRLYFCSENCSNKFLNVKVSS